MKKSLKYSLAVLSLFVCTVAFSEESDSGDKGLEMDLFADSEQSSEDTAEEELVIDLFADSETESAAENTEGEMDLFAEPEKGDSAVEMFEDLNADIPEPKKNVVARLFDNISGEMGSYYSWFFYLLEVEENANPEPDNKRHIFEVTNRLESYTGAGAVRFNVNAAINFGNQDNTYIPAFEDLEARVWQDWLQDTSRERRYLEVEQLFFSFFFDSLDIFVGKKTTDNTLSTIYGPADIYNPTDTNSPLRPRVFGKYLLELDLYAGNSSLTATIFPIYQGGKFVSPISRWAYYRAKEKQDEEGVTGEDQQDSEDSERDYTDINWENISYYLRFKSTLPGIDFFVSGFYGLVNNTVSRIISEEEIEYLVIPVINASAGFSAVIKELELHGEALYNYSLESKDDDYLRYVVGATFNIDGFPDALPMDSIKLVLEYAGEWLIKEQSHPDYQDSTNDSRGMKRALLTNIRFNISDDVTFSTFGKYDFDQQAGTFIGDINYKGFKNFDLQLGGQYFLSREDTDYYYWRHNHRLTAAVRYSY